MDRYGDQDTHQNRLDSCKLLWPSCAYMELCSNDSTELYRVTGSNSHTQPNEKNVSTSSVAEDPHSPHCNAPLGNGCYFLPRTLVLMEEDLKCRLYQYKGYPLKRKSSIALSATNEKETPPLKCEYHLPPHNKTYFRTMERQPLNGLSWEDDDTSAQCACYDIAWCLMTSACLSRGLKYLIIACHNYRSNLLFAP